MPFEEKESFKHKFAKELLCKWLREDYTGGKWSGDGIHMEYPLVPALRQCSHGNLLAYNQSIGDDRYMYYDRAKISFCPTYDECVAVGDIPIAVLDVVEVYKGVIHKGFEVYHTNRVSSVKLEKIEELAHGLGFELYEISADKILSQIQKPANILELCEQLI